MDRVARSMGFRLIVFIFLVALAFSVPAALAAEMNRAEYVESVEPLCKRDVEENVDIFKGVGAEIKGDKLKKASKRFTQAAAIFRQKLLKLESVPQPTSDEPRLTEWFNALRYEVRLLAKVGSSLQAEKKGMAQHFVQLLHQNANHANNLVLGFGFAYCTLDPGRFV